MHNEEGNLSTILLVDDDSDDQEFFQDALKIVSKNTVLKTAKNGVEAMRLLQNETNLPDLIFLDLNMPLKNGYECLRDIKNDDRLKTIYVIIFSTSLQLNTASEVYRDGASLYMVKPNSFSALTQLLAKVLALDWSNPNQINRDPFIFQG